MTALTGGRAEAAVAIAAHRAPALAVHGASVSYGARPAVEAVSLTVRAGEVYALVGPNGAGKSSLVKAICGRLALRAGTIEVGGAPAGSPAARRQVGVAPQRAALYDRLSALENVVCFARLAGIAAREAPAKAEAALRVTGLDPAGRVRAASLSGGQRQRANIAAAIVHGPQLLILDEPAAALDQEGLEETNALIEALCASGIAILLVTHDMAQADRLCGRVGVMNLGVLLIEESPERLKARYGGAGLAVRIEAEARADTHLAPQGFVRLGRGDWQGRAPDQRTVAALVESMVQAGITVRAVETAAPSLAEAVAGALKAARSAP